MPDRAIYVLAYNVLNIINDKITNKKLQSINTE